MHSTEGERLTLLTQAIDELAEEGLAELPQAAWAERVAGIWALVEGLDPEIARRRAGYATLRWQAPSSTS